MRTSLRSSTRARPNCRPDLGRARRHIDADHPRFEASAEQGEALLRCFLGATRDGNLDQLVDLLAADVVFCGDGGRRRLLSVSPYAAEMRLLHSFSKSSVGTCSSAQ